MIMQRYLARDRLRQEELENVHEQDDQPTTTTNHACEHHARSHAEGAASTPPSANVIGGIRWHFASSNQVKLCDTTVLAQNVTCWHA